MDLDLDLKDITMTKLRLKFFKAPQIYAYWF
jgi:hypothetical protein